MAGGVDEEETAVDTRVLDVPVTHRGELFTQVGAVLVFDVFNNGVPATSQNGSKHVCELCEYPLCVPVFVVDLVAVPRRVNNVQPELHTVLNNNYIPTPINTNVFVSKKIYLPCDAA